MNGVECYENKYEGMIHKALKKANPIIENYYYFISGRVSVSTAYNYINHIIHFLDSSKKEVKDLSIDDYTKYMLSIKKFTPSYQRIAYFALKRFSEYLFVSKQSESNIIDNILPPKNYEEITTKQKREIGFLTKEETQTFLATVKNGVGNSNAKTKQEKWRERDIAIILVLLTTGMRRSALYKLDIDNVDWDKKSIITIDKGNKVNIFYLPKETYNALAKWMKKRNHLMKSNSEEKALFVSNRLRRMSTDSIADIVKKYSVNIEGKHITPHKLRATYGTHLYNETHDIKFVQDRMMHSNPKTTELYIRGNEDSDRQKASDIMAKFLSND